jgi:hypothetical protein
MQPQDFERNIQRCLLQIKQLPPTEITYHLDFLLRAISSNNDPLNRQLLSQTSVFVAALTSLLSVSPKTEEEATKTYQHLTRAYQDLVNEVGADGWDSWMGYHILNVGSSLTAFISGMSGGLIGSFAGLARGLWNLENPLASFVIGLTTGVLLGSTIGFRLPKKLFRNELMNQLRRSLKGVDECMSLIRENQPPFAIHLEKARTKLSQHFFADNDAGFADFLQKENVSYEINTFYAQFVSRSLEGYLGHHAFISIKIDSTKEPLLLEFNTSQSDLTRRITQRDKRTVSGRTIVNMVALHDQLQLTQACTPTYIVTQLKPGENDCFSYVNKILVGTGQAPSSVKRFNGDENYIGRKIGFFIQKLSAREPEPFKPEIIDELPAIKFGAGAPSF